MEGARGDAPLNRIVLFDIDGTLLSPGPAPRAALGEALQEVFGTRGAIDQARFGGKTDLIIVREALPDGPAFDDPVWQRFWPRYVEALTGGLSRNGGVRVLAGAAELLDALSSNPAVDLGLVTGNIPSGAEAKLRHAGLLHHFDGSDLGAFAFDGATKADLGRAARARIVERWGEYAGGPHVVVGDTPSDIACAREGGFRAVAVATGSFSEAQLRLHDPDVVLPSLAPLETALAAILGSEGPSALG